MNIPTEFWVSALIRRANAEGAFAAISRKGDARAGAVLVKVWNSRACEALLFAEALNAKGESIWITPIAGRNDPEIDAYIERAIKRDPDIWLVDIEDVQGRHFLTEPVEIR
jgi:hypothetical protein